MEKGVSKYGEYDGDKYEQIREAGDGESNTRDTETRRKAAEIRDSTHPPDEPPLAAHQTAYSRPMAVLQRSTRAISSGLVRISAGMF